MASRIVFLKEVKTGVCITGLIERLENKIDSGEYQLISEIEWLDYIKTLNP